MSTESESAISLRDVELAADTLRGHAAPTPLVSSDLLNRRIGGRLWVKAESLQRTGSFKFRGAYNKLANLSAQERACGVVSYSSGNHGQAVALAAALFGTRATIVMPRDAPVVKVANTRKLGATVVLYDRATESREAIGQAISRNSGAVLVPPFDDPLVIAGQGTIGLEVISQLDSLGRRADLLLAGASGGGLLAGIATVFRHRSPDTRIHSAEPLDFDDLRRSLLSGVREVNGQTTASICDALMSPSPGVLTFPILRQCAAGGCAVTDDEVRFAMYAAYRYLRLVLEPGGAVALAAVLAKKVDVTDRDVVVVASGGNVDDSLFEEVLRTYAPEAAAEEITYA